MKAAFVKAALVAAAIAACGSSFASDVATSVVIHGSADQATSESDGTHGMDRLGAKPGRKMVEAPVTQRAPR